MIRPGTLPDVAGTLRGSCCLLQRTSRREKKQLPRPAHIGRPSPTVPPGGHHTGSQFLPHHQVTDVGVEDGDDGDFLQVSRWDTNDDTPELLDKSAQWLLGPLFEAVEAEDGRTRTAAKESKKIGIDEANPDHSVIIGAGLDSK